MLNMNRLVPNRLYRVKGQYSMPYDMSKPMKGYLVTVMSEDVQGTSDFFKNPYLRFIRYNRYYIERKIDENIAGQKIHKINKQRDIFEETFSKDHPDAKLITIPKMANGFNTVYEIGQFIERLNNAHRLEQKSRIVKSETKFNMIVDRLKQIGKEFPGYKKYLYFPLDQYVENPKDPMMWTKKKFLDSYGVTFLRNINGNWDFFKKNLGDWTIIFMNHNELFYMNVSEFNEETPNTIKKLIRKLRSTGTTISTEETDDDKLSDNEEENDTITKENNAEKIAEEKAVLKKQVDDLNIPNDDKDRIKKSIDIDSEKIEKNTTISAAKKTVMSAKNTNVKNSLITDKTLSDQIKASAEPEPTVKDVSETEITSMKIKAKEEMKKSLDASVMPAKTQQLARQAKLKQDIGSIKIDGDTTISELKVKAESRKIEDHEITSSVINKKMHNIKFDNFEKGYNSKLMDYDMMNILTSFAEKDRPLYLVSFSKEDNSTAADKIYTYKCIFEDEFGKRHNLTFDLPKFNDNKFMFLNGSDKIFLNQIIPLPVTKVAPDQVQMSSMYNKIFITRFGKNVSSKISKFFKIFGDIPMDLMTYEKGSNLAENTEFMTSMEYDELSTKFTSITIKNINTTCYFNQKEIRGICEAEGLTFDDETQLPFAIVTDSNNKKSLICMDVDSGEISQNADEEGTEASLSPIDYIVSNLGDDKIAKDFSKLAGSKRNIYTRAKIMAKAVPVILLIAFLDGLDSILDRLKCNWKFYDTKPKDEDSNKRGLVQFADGWLAYDMYPYNNSLLLNGLYDIPTEEYNFYDFSSKDIYYNIFLKLFGRRNIGNAFDNFKQLFVDPITKEILEDHKLPTDFIDLVIYANSLLENNVYDKDGDLKNYRLRSNEMLNDHLYKVLAKAYEAYHISADNKVPAKFSIKRNEVINSMYDSQVMEEYSNINPIFEIDRMRSTSYKGPGGCNMDRGFKIDKRAYNESMVGVLAQSSPVGPNVGVSRILSLNPNIKSLRGYIDVGSGKKKDEFDEVNMLSGAELLVPMTATHDDPQRVAMASTQSRHTIATMDSDPPLFGYGADKILAKVISNKFAFKADEDGYIKEYHPDLGFMVVTYKSGKNAVIDLTNKQSLNTGSGFYINNKLKPVFTEIGKKFKAGDVLAANEQFFEHNPLTGDVVYKSGPLARVAILHGSFVYEDSTLVTEKFAERMSSYIDEVKELRIGKNSNVYQMVHIGDNIKVNEPLITFDESYQDEFLNQMLEKMNDSDKEEFLASSKTQVKSKWTGEVVDIKVYYTCPKSEMSESLRKSIEDYEKIIKERHKIFEENGIDLKDMTTLADITEPTQPVNGKIAGTKMEEFDVLIKFFVKTTDFFSVGDKLSFSRLGR